MYMAFSLVWQNNRYLLCTFLDWGKSALLWGVFTLPILAHFMECVWILAWFLCEMHNNPFSSKKKSLDFNFLLSCRHNIDLFDFWPLWANLVLKVYSLVPICYRCRCCQVHYKKNFAWLLLHTFSRESEGDKSVPKILRQIEDPSTGLMKNLHHHWKH